MLNQDLFQLLNECYKRYKYIDLGIYSSGIIIENGTPTSLSKDFAQRLKNIGLNQAFISFFHSDPQKHDSVTGLNNSFFLTKESTINLFRSGVKIKAHVVLTRENHNRIPEITNELRSFGVSEIRILKLVKTGNAINNWEHLVIENGKQDEVIFELFKKREELPLKMTFSGFPEIIPCRPFIGSTGCQAGTRLFFTTFSGDVFPCAGMRNKSSFCIGKIFEIEKILDYHRKNKKEFYEKCINK